MSYRGPHWPSFLLGSVLIITGSTLAGLSAFRNRVWIVFAGFVCFLVGYRVTQQGADWISRVRRPLRGNTTKVVYREGARWGLMLVGMFGIALGVTKFAQTILEPSAQRAATAGLYSIGGYIWAHTVLHHGPL